MSVHDTFKTASVLLVVGSAVAGGAVAESAVREYRIAAGPLAVALNQLAEVGGLQLIYDAEIANGLRSGGLSGQFSPEAALSKLLSGSGLTYRLTADGNVLIQRQALNQRDEPTALPAINVVGKSSNPFFLRAKILITPTITATTLPPRPRPTRR
ncbi:STN domain-containing protein [Methylomonas sp. UP202]|uniref:STN domain-containing protein n=1 Tax=Methylomonas sp. UP202 TaxID=3040943 RepID=UPI00247963C4|nr:STN domain-containing protein [Methylomonas sp. UP202]WGS88269.1 STN domain-containing protein [Methylomonas sp. UP202]